VSGREVDIDSMDTIMDGRGRGGHLGNDDVRLDKEGRFVDSDIDSYHSNPDPVHEKVDKDIGEDLRVHGLTLEEWKMKEEKEKHLLEELNKK